MATSERPLLAQLWADAVAVSERSGVPAPALVAAYLDLLSEHGPTPPPEASAAIGERLVAQFGALAVLDDDALRELAEKYGLSVDAVRRACGT